MCLPEHGRLLHPSVWSRCLSALLQPWAHALPVLAAQADLDTQAAADEMNTDLEVITLRESAQTALEVCVTSRNEKTQRYFWFNFNFIL